MLGEVLSLVPFAAITVKCISSVSDGLAGMTVSINPLSASQCVPSLLWTKGLTSSCPCMGDQLLFSLGLFPEIKTIDSS